ncbi:MAG: hypothetical protein AAGK78_10820 [Planctomycetota bacterium]
MSLEPAQFASAVTGTTGSVTAPGNAIGSDVNTFARINSFAVAGPVFDFFQSAATLSLDLPGPLVNGSGADLFVWEIGDIETFSLSLPGQSTGRLFDAVATGERTDVGYNINFVAIDLSDFGLAEDDVVSGPLTFGSVGGNSPDIGALAFNISTSAIPTPAAALGGLGLLSILGLRRRGPLS